MSESSAPPLDRHEAGDGLIAALPRVRIPPLAATIVEEHRVRVEHLRAILAARDAAQRARWQAILRPASATDSEFP